MGEGALLEPDGWLRRLTLDLFKVAFNLSKEKR